MSKIRYRVVSALCFALFACNHETDRPTTPNTPEMGAGTDADARAASDVQTEDATKNFSETNGGTASRAGDTPEGVGGTGGTGGSVGRSDNNGTPNGKTP